MWRDGFFFMIGAASGFSAFLWLVYFAGEVKKEN